MQTRRVLRQALELQRPLTLLLRSKTNAQMSTVATDSAHPHLAEATRLPTATIDLRHETTAIASDHPDHPAVVTKTIPLQETTADELHHQEIHTDPHQETPTVTPTESLYHREHMHQSPIRQTTHVPGAHRVLSTTTVEAMVEATPIADTEIKAPRTGKYRPKGRNQQHQIANCRSAISPYVSIVHAAKLAKSKACDSCFHCEKALQRNDSYCIARF
jgi:hypothetical protein